MEAVLIYLHAQIVPMLFGNIACLFKNSSYLLHPFRERTT